MPLVPKDGVRYREVSAIKHVRYREVPLYQDNCVILTKWDFLFQYYWNSIEWISMNFFRVLHSMHFLQILTENGFHYLREGSKSSCNLNSDGVMLANITLLKNLSLQMSVQIINFCFRFEKGFKESHR